MAAKTPTTPKTRTPVVVPKKRAGERDTATPIPPPGGAVVGPRQALQEVRGAIRSPEHLCELIETAARAASDLMSHSEDTNLAKCHDALAALSYALRRASNGEPELLTDIARPARKALARRALALDQLTADVRAVAAQAKKSGTVPTSKLLREQARSRFEALSVQERDEHLEKMRVDRTEPQFRGHDGRLEFGRWLIRVVNQFPKGCDPVDFAEGVSPLARRGEFAGVDEETFEREMRRIFPAGPGANAKKNARGVLRALGMKANNAVNLIDAADTARAKRAALRKNPNNK